MTLRATVGREQSLMSGRKAKRSIHVCIREGREPLPEVPKNVWVTLTHLEGRETEIFAHGLLASPSPQVKGLSLCASRCTLGHQQPLTAEHVPRCQRKPRVEKRGGHGKREALSVLERDAAERYIGMGPEDTG